jgi:hypothetical protein
MRSAFRRFAVGREGAPRPFRDQRLLIIINQPLQEVWSNLIKCRRPQARAQ